jgi:hypothetical protein
MELSPSAILSGAGSGLLAGLIGVIASAVFLFLPILRTMQTQIRALEGRLNSPDTDIIRQLSREGSLKGVSLLPHWGTGTAENEEKRRPAGSRKSASTQPRGPGKLAKPKEPWPVVLVTDVGGSACDPGDLLAIACLGGLEALGFVSVRAIIFSARPGDDMDMAQAADLVRRIGLHSCILGVSAEHAPESDTIAGVVPAAVAFKRVLESIRDDTLLVINTSTLTDLSAALRADRELLGRKLRNVAVFGHCVEHHLHSSLDVLSSGAAGTGMNQDFFLRPDPTHHLFAADLPSARHAFHALQELRVPMVLVSRYAAYEGAEHHDLFDDLSRLNVPHLARLRSDQRLALESLFERCCLPPGDENRAELPDRCNALWFAETMCGGTLPLDKAEVWSHVSSFPMYDWVTIASAVPEICARLFTCTPEFAYDCGTGEAAAQPPCRRRDPNLPACLLSLRLPPSLRPSLRPSVPPSPSIPPSTSVWLS